MTLRRLALLVLFAVSCSSEDSDSGGASCSMTCSASSSDMTASLSCGHGAVTCDRKTDMYGTPLSMTCQYDDGKAYWCQATLDQIGRITAIECGGEGASCSAQP